MSDSSISIVPRVPVYPDKENKAKEIFQWLVTIDAVKPTPSDCVLGSDTGFAISDGAKYLTDNPELLPFGLNTNGLEIITTRQVFDSGENGIDQVICPNCQKNIATEDWDFIFDWAENGSNNIACPICGIKAEIHLFKFTPEWGFSDLAFTFWNWPSLNHGFINEIKKRLNCDINLVYNRI